MEVQVFDLIKNISEFIGAIGALWIFFAKLNKVITNQEIEKKKNKENYLSILRLIIVNDNMPLEERIAAGDKYVKEGGNGAIKHLYGKLLKQLDEENETKKE